MTYPKRAMYSPISRWARRWLSCSIAVMRRVSLATCVRSNVASSSSFNSSESLGDTPGVYGTGVALQDRMKTCYSKTTNKLYYFIYIKQKHSLLAWRSHNSPKFALLISRKKRQLGFVNFMNPSHQYFPLCLFQLCGVDCNLLDLSPLFHNFPQIHHLTSSHQLVTQHDL